MIYVAGQYIYIHAKLNKINQIKTTWNVSENIFIEMFNMHQTFQAPIGMFDAIIKWLKKYLDDLSDNKRVYYIMLPQE